MRTLAKTLLTTLIAGTFSVTAHATSLIDLYQHALETNPALKMREFTIDQAQAQQAQARSRLLPQLSLTGNYSWNEYDDSLVGKNRYTGARGSLQARQALLDLGSYFRLQGAGAAVQQTEQLREAARMELAGEVVDRYLEVLQSMDELVNLEAEKKATLSQLMRMRFLQARHLAKLNDLYEIEAYYAALLTREIEAHNAKAIALEQLRETTGLKPERVASLARTDLPPLAWNEEQWTSEALEKSPVLAALSQAIESAKLLVKSSKADHSPRVDLTASSIYSDQGYDNRIVPSYQVNSLGAQFTLPLYEGGRVQGTVHESRARLNIARQQHEQSRREIESKTRSAYLNASASYARIASKNEEVKALQKTVDAQGRSYELGASTIVDVLRAQQGLFKSRTELSRARYDYIRNLDTLRILSGSMTTGVIEEISGWMAAENS